MFQQRAWMFIFIALLVANTSALAKAPICTIYSTTNCPKNLTECITVLKQTLDKTILDRFRTESEDVTYDYHLTTGLAIRNNWLRSQALTDYFNKLGIYALDDMSGIILTSLWRDLHHQPIRLDEQVHEYKRYWFYNDAQVTERRSIPENIWNKTLPVYGEGTTQLASSKGKIIILLIFTDDISNPAAVSTLNLLSKKFSKTNLQILGLGSYFPQTQTKKEDFIRNNKPMFPVVLEDMPEFRWELKKALTLPGGLEFPETILIGKDGNMITRFNGWEPKTTPALLEKEIITALKVQPQATTKPKLKSKQH